MNSADKRIEELLNRAGQTISDLPRKQGTSVSEPYSGEYRKKANGSAWRWYLNIDDSDMDDYESIRSTMVLKLYILHLTDVIDRLEWALENVCGERDYLKQQFRSHGYRDCKSCAHRYDCEQLSDYCCGYVFAGVPENWSVDDDL